MTAAQVVRRKYGLSSRSRLSILRLSVWAFPSAAPPQHVLIRSELCARLHTDATGKDEADGTGQGRRVPCISYNIEAELAFGLGTLTFRTRLPPITTRHHQRTPIHATQHTTAKYRRITYNVMDASAGAAGAAATAAATVADFESELRGLIASTLRSGSSVFETLRTLLSALASVPTDVNMDDDNTFLLEEREMNAATILASIQRWVVGLDQRMQLAHPIVRQSQPSRSPTISSDNTADDGGSTLASHFWLPDGSRNTPTDPTRFVEALRANAADLMLAAESVVERAPSPAHIDFLLRIIPLALPIPSPPGTQSRRISHNTVRSDFLLPFHGRLVELLERYILNANKYMRSHSTHVYAKCFPILQSSGTGKSKLAVQLSAYQAGMMVCTRSPHTQSVRDHVSFPPNDDSVYDFLSHREELDSFPHHKRIACWLGAYFAVLAYSLEKRLVASGCFNGLEEPPRAPTGYNMPPSSSSAPSSSTLPPADAATATAVSDLDPNDSPARTSSITCKHDHPNLCWQTVVFHLALAIHDGPDFVSNYRFEQSGQRHDERRCPDSCLNFTAYNDPDTSFPEPTPVSNPSSIDSDMQRSRTLPVPDGAPLPYVPPPAARPSLPTRHPRFRSYLLGKIAQIAKENFKKEDPGPQPADKEESLPIEKIAEYASDGYMRPYLRRLERLLPGPLHNSHFFFLVIDEVIPIRHCLPVLRRLWAEAKPRFSWLMFTDTDSKVAPRASPHIRLASARLDVKQQLMVIPPFCKLGFDAAIQHDLESLRKPLLSGQLTFGHLLDKLSSFRRPLWSTSLYRSANAPRRPNLANILLKLLNQERWPAVWPDPGPTGKDFADPNSPFFKGIMAIAGQRLPLRFIGHQGVQLYSGNESTESSSAFVGTSGEALQQSGSINFLQNQASHHLRVISKVRDTVNFFVTSTVSEPALSLSVASLLRGISVSDNVRECA